MKLGLIGFPQVGKRTLFRLLTGKESEPENGKGEAQGLARVRDERFERLVEIYRPRVETPAQIEFSLLPDLEKQAERNTRIWRVLEKVDVICHLVRAFPEDTVFHVAGSVDPRRDITALNEELRLNDLLFIEKRIERGFIQAEVIKYEDLIQLGNEQKVREEGKLLQKGRDYVVEDGDIINFLFNV
ncbi:MAG: DUF933 domain-containing protein [Deltaproteobacteria bacterium]|jgi:ribosome-binding ATPase YchF (GTP1/OBG family)|nr:DUF933 domain-containing protein [Deltaproteobacteria bacterium]